MQKYSRYDFHLDSLLKINDEYLEVKEILLNELHVGHIGTDELITVKYDDITIDMIPNTSRPLILKML